VIKYSHKKMNTLCIIFYLSCTSKQVKSFNDILYHIVNKWLFGDHCRLHCGKVSLGLKKIINAFWNFFTQKRILDSILCYLPNYI